MSAKTMTTRFLHINTQGEELYIYRIPECDMCRLHKGDIINLRRYKRGNPSDTREAWQAVVVREPTFEIGWSDPVDAGKDAYDIDSIIPVQVVCVEIKTHQWM